MNIVQIIDDVTSWAQENICNLVQLKVPPTEDTEPIDGQYEYELAHPSAFALYVPSKDKLPENLKSEIPYLSVRFVEGADQLDAGGGRGGSITLQFILCTWDPGLHSKDIFRYQGGMSYSNDEPPGQFVRSGEGWRDAWNFLDTARRVIESNTYVAGYEMDVNSGVHFGPWEEMDGSNDFYPFWLSWVQFTLNYPIVRNVEAFNEYL